MVIKMIVMAFLITVINLHVIILGITFMITIIIFCQKHSQATPKLNMAVLPNPTCQPLISGLGRYVFLH